MLDDLKAGKTYRSVRFMENVAGHYGIPSVNFAYDVMDLLNKDQLVFKGEKDKSYPGKVVFTNDGTHPTFDGGHVIYTRTLAAALTELGKQQAGSAAFLMPAPLYPTHYEQAKMYSVDEFVRTGGWQPVTKDDKVYQYFQGDSGKLPVLLSSADPEDSIVVRFKGIRAGPVSYTHLETGTGAGERFAGSLFQTVSGERLLYGLEVVYRNTRCRPGGVCQKIGRRIPAGFLYAADLPARLRDGCRYAGNDPFSEGDGTRSY